MSAFNRKTFYPVLVTVEGILKCIVEEKDSIFVKYKGISVASD